MRKNIVLTVLCCCCSALLWAQNDGSRDSSVDSTEQSTTEHRLSGFDSELSESFVNQSLIEQLPFRSLSELYLLTPSAHYLGTGNQNYIYGQRLSGRHTFLDGMQVNDAADFPFRSIEKFAVLTHQTPIQLGNAIGGFTVLETPTVSDFGLNIEFLSSTPFQSELGHHILEIDASIPLTFSQKKQSRFPSLYVAANLSTTNDPTPSWAKSYKANTETLNRLSSAPLAIYYQNNGAARFVPAALRVGNADINEYQFKQNVGKKALNAFAKLHIPLGKKADLTVGSYLKLSDEKLFIHENALFNSQNNHQYLTQNMDNYVRFSHNLLQNKNTRINYQLQVQHSDYQATSQNERLKDDLFAYGDYGLFSEDRTPVYTPNVVGNLQGIEFQGSQTTSINYTPTTNNPLLANHNLHYLSLSPSVQIGNYYNSLDGFSQGGLVNGTVPNRLSMATNMWNNLGQVHDYYGKGHNNLLRANLLFNIDHKKHHFKFGGEYVKETRRLYEVNPKNLWSLMYSWASQPGVAGILRDLENPILVIDGVNYTIDEYIEGIDDESVRYFSANDTINYNYIRVSNNYFDDQFRSRFGYGDLDFVDVFSHSAEEFSLDMFTPDQLLNGGGVNAVINSFGYDYLGNELSEQSSLVDFWQQKNERGLFSRNAAAFQPIYGAAYGQYQFKNKQLRFSAGLRMDYYNANQPVLKDPYLMYDAYTAGEVTTINNEAVIHPSSIEGDFVVYVDDEIDPTKITGYRDGDQWYSSSGFLTSDPRALVGSGGSITPYIAAPLSENPKYDIQHPNFDPNSTLKDYEGVVNLLPQLSLELFLSKNIKAFAHYTSSTQAPNNNRLNIHQYYNLNFSSYAQDRIDYPVDNPALAPLRTNKWQVGTSGWILPHLKGSLTYQQASFDVIGIKRLLSAYPNSYYTYSTIENHKKGFTTTLQYVHANLQAGFNYNYQFRTKNENATGFFDTSTSVVYSGDEHVDHTVNANVVFNTQDGQHYLGPMRKNGQPLLPNFSIGLFAQYRSGKLYESIAVPVPEALVGVQIRRDRTNIINRLPSFSFLNLKINKTFKLLKNSNLKLDTYVWIQNVLNSKNVFNGYTYTGQADDDGYLASPYGQQFLDAQDDPQAASAQYNIKLQNPNNFDIPRLIHLGAALKF